MLKKYLIIFSIVMFISIISLILFQYFDKTDDIKEDTKEHENVEKNIHTSYEGNLKELIGESDKLVIFIKNSNCEEQLCNNIQDYINNTNYQNTHYYTFDMNKPSDSQFINQYFQDKKVEQMIEKQNKREDYEFRISNSYTNQELQAYQDELYEMVIGDYGSKENFYAQASSEIKEKHTQLLRHQIMPLSSEINHKIQNFIKQAIHMMIENPKYTKKDVQQQINGILKLQSALNEDEVFDYFEIILHGASLQEDIPIRSELSNEFNIFIIQNGFVTSNITEEQLKENQEIKESIIPDYLSILNENDGKVINNIKVALSENSPVKIIVDNSKDNLSEYDSITKDFKKENVYYLNINYFNDNQYFNSLINQYKIKQFVLPMYLQIDEKEVTILNSGSTFNVNHMLSEKP